MLRKNWLVVIFLLISVSPASSYDFKSGFSERIRHEFRKNISDLENATLDNRNYFKIKTSVWGKLELNKDVDLYLKLTNENKPYMYWAGASAAVGKSASKKGYRYEIDEVVFDNLYFDWNNFINLPVDLRLGRQDLDTYGEGFLIKEGTPADSTRTYYFNALKTTWHAFEKDDLEFIFVRNNKTDDLLPVINELSGGGQMLTSSNETAYILYNKNDILKDFHLENYYIYKKEEAGSSSANRMTREETSLNTLGTFACYKFNPWALRSQLAYQFGDYGEQERSGLGGYLYLDRDFSEVKFAPKVSCGVMYLSGDKRGTEKNEAWDPLFSRFPMLPDAFGLYLAGETETYYWANFTAYNAGFILVPNKKTKLSCKYYFLRANAQVNPTAALFSGSGKTRGSLPEVRIDYNFNKNITALFVADYFMPGNFYVKTADEAVFLKTELQIKF